MPRTIAYSNKGGFWKSTYTWYASFMGKIGRKFFSSSVDGAREGFIGIPSKLVWKHHLDDDTQRTNYYGEVGGSGISVSFNNNVSANKIYKSISIEGTSNIENNPNTFIVNAENNPNKQFSIGTIKDKGGILYGHIGQSNTLLDGSNIKVVGRFSLESFIPVSYSTGQYATPTINGITLGSTGDDNEGSTFVDIPVKRSSVTNNSKYIVKINPSEGSGLSEFYTIFFDPIQLGPDVSYSDINVPPLNFSDPAPIAEAIFPLGEVFPFQPPVAYLTPLEGGDIQMNPQYNTTIRDQIIAAQGPIVTLLEVTPQNINGAPPRGQYAQAEIALGSAPYELYSVSVNYEPTNLDHSK